MAVSAGDGGLDNAVLAGVEACYIRAKLRNNSRELMTEGDGNSVVGAWVRCGRCESWASEILMQICTTDAYVRRRDLC